MIAGRPRRRAIEQLLRAERHKTPGAPEHLPLHGHRNGEREARTARLLVLDARPEAAVAPINALRQIRIVVVTIGVAAQPLACCIATRQRCALRRRRSIAGGRMVCDDGRGRGGNAKHCVGRTGGRRGRRSDGGGGGGTVAGRALGKRTDAPSVASREANVGTQILLVGLEAQMRGLKYNGVSLPIRNTYLVVNFVNHPYRSAKLRIFI